MMADPIWQRRITDRNAAAAAGVTLQQWRSNLLQDIAEENVDEITQPKCHRWANHSQTYLGRCLAHEEIDG